VPARLQILASAFLFSTAGAAIKACSLSGVQIAGVRSGIAALALLAMMKQARGRWSTQATLVGCAYAATMILFVTANKMTTAANAIFLQATAPLYLLLLAPLWLGEAVRRRDVFYLGAMAAGMTMFFLGAERSGTAPAPQTGNALAAMSALTWAIAVTGFRRIARDSPGTDVMFRSVVAGNAIAFAVCVPAAWPLAGASAVDWLILVYLGVFQVGLGYVFLTHGVRRIGALEASLLLLLENALNPVWVWLLHGETPGTWSTCGGALIIAATAIRAWRDAPPRRPATLPVAPA
jgi:drug/metabolite transporter (DMT)-like permease